MLKNLSKTERCQKILADHIQDIQNRTKKCDLQTMVKVIYRIDKVDARIAAVCREFVKREFFEIMFGDMYRYIKGYYDREAHEPLLCNIGDLELKFCKSDDWYFYIFIDNRHSYLRNNESLWIQALERLKADIA